MLEQRTAKTVEGGSLIFNGNFESQWVNLPPLAAPGTWYRAIDTNCRPARILRKTEKRSASIRATTIS